LQIERGDLAIAGRLEAVAAQYLTLSAREKDAQLKFGAVHARSGGARGRIREEHNRLELRWRTYRTPSHCTVHLGVGQDNRHAGVGKRRCPQSRRDRRISVHGRKTDDNGRRRKNDRLHRRWKGSLASCGWRRGLIGWQVLQLGVKVHRRRGV